MKILHVTDLHFRQDWFEWVASHAAEFDAVCITGDLLDMFCGPVRALDHRPSSLTRALRPSPRVSLHQQARWVREWIRRCPGRLFLCSGNHDFWPTPEECVDNDAEAQWLRKARELDRVSVDGDASLLGGYRFSCVRWAGVPAVDGDTPTIVLCHAPPEQTPVSSDLGHEAGDFEVRAAIQGFPKGSLVLSGHIHWPHSWYAQVGNVWCFNPGVSVEAPIPNHIVIDTDTKLALYRSESSRAEKSFAGT